MTTIPAILDAAARERAKFRAPHDRAILARASLTALYAETLRRAVQARENGIEIKLVEWSTSDSIEATYRGRSVRFRRGERNILRVVVTGFPANSEMRDRELTPPDALSAAGEWAESVVDEVLCSLLTETP